MKATGIVRQIDNLGRIVLPKELRKVYQIEDKDFFEIFVEKDMIILKKYVPACIFCGETDGLISYDEKAICSRCAEKIKELTTQTER